MTDFSRIAPHLYMGSKPRRGDPTLDRFDVIVCAAEEYQPPSHHFPRALLVRLKLDDPKINEEQRRAAIKAGRFVANAVRHNARVLVTCQMGINRSGLVTGIALIEMGHTATAAIHLIRTRRGEVHGHTPLFNNRFCEILHEHAATIGRVSSVA